MPHLLLPVPTPSLVSPRSIQPGQFCRSLKGDPNGSSGTVSAVTFREQMGSRSLASELFSGGRPGSKIRPQMNQEPSDSSIENRHSLVGLQLTCQGLFSCYCRTVSSCRTRESAAECIAEAKCANCYLSQAGKKGGAANQRAKPKAGIEASFIRRTIAVSNAMKSVRVVEGI